QGAPEDAGAPLQAALAIMRRLGARPDAGLVERALGALQRGEPRDAAPVPLLSRQGEAAGGRQSRRDRQAWALERLRTTGSLSPGAYAHALAVSADTALLNLRELVARG